MATPLDKRQLNVLVPADIDDFVEQLQRETGVNNKSLIVHVILAFTRQNYSAAAIKRMVGDFAVFGEKGLKGWT